MTFLRDFAAGIPLSFGSTILSLLCLFAGVTWVAAENASNNPQNQRVTIELPPDHCYCVSIKWYDILTFFALNYGAHAMTVRMEPGQPASKSIIAAIGAIFFPYGSIGEALTIISYVPLYKLPWTENPLKKARRSGALCTVVKAASNSDEDFLQSAVRGHDRKVTVFGQLGNLPPGYTFKVLSRKDKVKPKDWKQPEQNQTSELEPVQESKVLNSVKHPDIQASSGSAILQLPQSSSFLKGTVSVGQAAYIIFTLVRASSQCGKLTEFGYVSPAFTVVPYATMSLINAFMAVTTPNYPMKYLVSSAALDEAIAGGWKFDRGTIVGQLVEEDITQSVNPMSLEDPYPRFRKRARYKNFLDVAMLVVVYLLGVMSIAGPYVVMQALTQFQTGVSTALERRVIITGIVAGQVVAILVVLIEADEWWAHFTGKKKKKEEQEEDDKALENSLVYWITVGIIMFFGLVLTIPVLWSFVIVGQMLRKMGQCTHLSAR